jgi:hypothetical protein
LGCSGVGEGERRGGECERRGGVVSVRGGER